MANSIARISKNLQGRKEIQQLAKFADKQTTAVKKLRKEKASLKLGELTLQGGAAFAAGTIDELVPELPIGETGVAPSLLLGILTTGASIPMGSRTVAVAGMGMVLPHIYLAGKKTGATIKLKFAK